ncbi:clan AA aspartic protease [Campylobacter coli]|uniref:clan AA aspartic protease n=1 Tax=Campylobacter coli TaxID=195 RepID=UPI00094DBE8A|nr:clan AA aspartic protease [Campylobacter coli]ECQ1390158.1 clan AA aspartic protease [Campylobacter coli]EDO7029496.1 clan AA aspartic protease [Campylobacter coli]EDO7110237.1 clan AA aspartic protease [Campylobacter coli]HEE9130081.1 clan AA aspartic protease [Campylobacter coli]
MLFLLKKILPQLFTSIILEDKKNILKTSIYKNHKLISSNEKTFDKSEKLLEYVKTLNSKFLFYHTALFLNVKEQGLIPSKNDEDFERFNVGKMSLKSIALNNALIYTATEHIEYFNELFEDYGGLDFLYSPFAILYHNILKEKPNSDKTTLYAYKHEHILTLIICRGIEILYGDIIFFEEELDLEFGHQEENLDNLGEDTLNDTEVTLDNFNETLEDKLNPLDQFDNILGNNENDSEFLDGKDKFDLEEMDQFGNDIELCRHIVTSIEKFYKDDKYPSAFIDKALILSTKELDQSAIEFLEEETLLEIESKPINTLDSIIELMQKELQ